MASASSVCLTTLEYAVKGSQPVVIHCPSCGIRLIIKHQDNLASRLTSVSLLVGMSMFICYNIGVKSGLVGRMTEKIFRWFGGNGRKRKPSISKSSSSQHNQQMGNGHQRQYGDGYSNMNSMNNMGNMNGGYKENVFHCNHMSAELLTNSDQDSGIDIIPNMTHRDSYYYDDDEFDGQFDELLSYNAAYSNQYIDGVNDYYTGNSSMNAQYGNGYRIGGENFFTGNGTVNQQMEDEGNGKIRQVKTKTITKIDQVLQSIDDIKKSIVEIDDDIYHIAGSTYDSYSPYFLTLSTTAMDDFDSMESGSQNGWNTGKDESYIPDKPSGMKEMNNFFPPSTSSPYSSPTSPSLSSPANTSERRTIQKSNLPHKSMKNIHRDRRSNKNVTENNEKAGEKSFQNSRPSRTSQSSMSDLEQMEWDFDFEPFSPVSTNSDSNIEQTTQLSNEHSSQQQDSTNDSELLDNNQSIHSNSSTLANASLTDEQKLKNMHHLFDDAKRMGLLNNILDALHNENSYEEEYPSGKHHENEYSNSKQSTEYS